MLFVNELLKIVRFQFEAEFMSGSCSQRIKHAKRVLVVTESFNVVVNDFAAENWSQ